MGLISSMISSSKIADTSGLEKQITASGNKLIGASSNDDLLRQWGINPTMQRVVASDLINKDAISANLGQMADTLGQAAISAGGEALGGLQGIKDAEVKLGVGTNNTNGNNQTNQFLLGGLIAGAASAALQGIGTGIGAAIASAKAKKEAARLNSLQEQAEYKQQTNFANAAQNIDSESDNRALLNYAALGGYLGVPIGDGALGYNLLMDNIENDRLNQLAKENAVANLGNSFFSVENPFANGGPIYIKPENKGKFTASANRAGMGVQEYARHILANKEDYSSTLVKRANFARNASKWKHADGGNLKYPNEIVTYFDSNKNKQFIKAKKLENMQLPEGSIVVQNADGLPGEVNNIIDNKNPLQAFRGAKRTIKYGKTREQNDTTYRVLRPIGVGLANSKDYFNDVYYKADGGFLFDNNGFTNGVRYINNGSTHELNPNEGVPVGIAPDGKLNLVEEGETIYNGYVFSNRINIPKSLRETYKLKGNIKTFSDAFKYLAKESEERPNDPISKEGLNKIAQDLMIEQEIIKRKMQQKKNNKKYAKGGHLYFDGSALFKSLTIPTELELKNLGPNKARFDELNRQGTYYTPFYDIDQTSVSSLLSNNNEATNNFKKYLETIPMAEDTPIQLKGTPDETEVKEAPISIKTSPNWGNILRYSAPLLAGAIGVGLDAARVTNKPTTYDAVPDYNPVAFNPIGNYLTYTPFDTTYALNRAESQANATRRALMQSNSPSRNAAILAADYNAINNQGDIFRKAQEANLAQRQMVEDFNRGTNQANSQGFLQADTANREGALKYANAALEQARLNDLSSNAAWQGRAANIDNLLGSVAGIGSEMINNNRLNFLIKSGAFGSLSEEQLRDLKFSERQIKDIKGKDYKGKSKKEGGSK